MRKQRLLVVDDNLLNLKVANRALAPFNLTIDEVTDGQKCLDKVNSGIKYDLILMDIMMPYMSGETAFSKLKEDPNFKTPVIAMTADAGNRDKYIKEYGFDDYIEKIRKNLQDHPVSYVLWNEKTNEEKREMFEKLENTMGYDL